MLGKTTAYNIASFDAGISAYELGIGLNDVHLIASVFINPPTLLWTRDKRLRELAVALGIHVGRA